MMKSLLVLLVCINLSCGSKNRINEKLMYLDKRASQVDEVLRVQLIEKQGGSKYHWAKVRIIEVYKTKSNFKSGMELSVAYYNDDEGIPIGLSTIYLEKYNDAKTEDWALFGRTSKLGVSHVVR